MRTVIAIYIVAILALAGGLVYIDKSLNTVQHETDTAVTEYTPLVVPDSGRDTSVVPSMPSSNASLSVSIIIVIIL